MSVPLTPALASIATLRKIVAPAAEFRVLPFGVAALDALLGAGGLRAGALHEATARSTSLADDAATTLFLAGIAAREASATGGLVLWASCRADLYAPALEQAGLPAASVIYAQPRDDAALLAVVEDAVRDGTPCAIVAEAARVPMVATRRFQLAAAEAEIPVLLLRRARRRDQEPVAEPSAAWTRWRIGAVPSERLSVAGVGRPRWSVECVRQRGGEGFSLIMEGSDETGRLAVPAVIGRGAAETVGTVRSAAA
ncbi:protein ImuA [Sphingomonas sp. GM_Shp_2]|uniref:ImuA family protein n=1 Tax=Sphingomonas sp. GM_Shp_2 TaxID=2937380 RepID=UPI00226ACA8B|nr:protein ImuA [Sphingomonas sp. GM_Shp_2]